MTPAARLAVADGAVVVLLLVLDGTSGGWWWPVVASWSWVAVRQARLARRAGDTEAGDQ